MASPYETKIGAAADDEELGTAGGAGAAIEHGPQEDHPKDGRCVSCIAYSILGLLILMLSPVILLVVPVILLVVPVILLFCVARYGYLLVACVVNGLSWSMGSGISLPYCRNGALRFCFEFNRQWFRMTTMLLCPVWGIFWILFFPLRLCCSTRGGGCEDIGNGLSDLCEFAPLTTTLRWVKALPQTTRAKKLNDEARDLQKKGFFKQAEPLFVESMSIFADKMGKKHPDYATCLSNLALLYESMGAFEKAEPLYMESISIRAETLGKRHPDCAYSLSNLALLYRLMGAYEKAEPLYIESMSIWAETWGKKHPDYATNLNNLALLYSYMGAYEKAEPLYVESMNIKAEALGKRHPAYALSLNNLASLYSGSMGDYEKAEPLYVESISIMAEALGKKHPDYAMSLNNFASLFQSMGAYEKAEPLYVESITIKREVLGKTHPSYGTGLSNLAGLYTSIYKSQPSEHLGRLGQALALAEEACNIEAELLLRCLGTLSSSQKSSFVKSLDGALTVFLGIVASICQEERCSKEELQDATRRSFRAVALRKNLIFDSQAAESELVAEAMRCEDPNRKKQLLELDGKLKRARQALAKETLGNAADPQKAKELPDEIEKLEKEVGRLLPAAAENLNSLSASELIAKLAGQLPASAVFVEFVVVEAEYAAFVLCPGASSTFLRFVILGLVEEIDALGGQLRELAGGATKQMPNFKESGIKLRQMLLDPVLDLAKEHLGKEPEHLILAPDGELSRLPFAALMLDREIPPTGKKGKPRIGFVLDEAYTLSYVNAARDLLRWARPAAPHRHCSIFSNPAFSKKFQQLDSAAEEGADVETLMKTLPNMEVEHFTGDAATKEALLGMRQPWTLHIITHGFFVQPQGSSSLGAVDYGLKDVDEPLLRCGLALADTSKDSTLATGGVVTGLEIRNMDLRGTKLVTLSACETGEGQVSRGQGVSGLGRAVLLAGAESALLTQWPVDDTATKDFMVAFYKALINESTDPFHRARCLRDAQRQLMKKKPHPNFWAPFVLYGMMGPVI